MHGIFKRSALLLQNMRCLWRKSNHSQVPFKTFKVPFDYLGSIPGQDFFAGSVTTMWPWAHGKSWSHHLLCNHPSHSEDLARLAFKRNCHLKQMVFKTLCQCSSCKTVSKLTPKKLLAKPDDASWRKQSYNFPLQFFNNSSLSVLLIIQMNRENQEVLFQE